MIRDSPFGSGPRGEDLRLYTLANERGLEVSVTTYGGIVTALRAPDRHGRVDDVVLGFDSIEPYLSRHPYFGAIIGRIAGRLTPPHFSLEGTWHPLAANQFPHHLHGGQSGFDRRIWDARCASGPNGEELILTYLSPDGEEGYPGNVRVEVSYAVGGDNALVIRYQARTDRATPLSLTNHSYFNLGGESAGSVASHQIQILADEFTPVGPDFAHTGSRRPVTGLPNDFRRPATLGSRLEGLFGRHGDNYLLRAGTRPRTVARVFEPVSGRVLDVSTTESCLQFYTGVSLDGTAIGKSGRPYGPFAGLCLECQGYPAAPHFLEFESITLFPSETYWQETRYRFGVTGSGEFPPLADTATG